MAGLGFSPTLGSQEVVPLAPEDALKVHTFNEVCPLAFSPNGKWLAYVVRNNERAESENGNENEIYVRTGILASNRASDIRLSDTQTGETKSLTLEKGANWLPTWSPDGKSLAFFSDRDGSGQARVWVWDSVRDTLRRVSDKNVRANHLLKGIEWTPDSRKVLVTIVPDHSMNAYLQEVFASGKLPVRASSPVPGSTVALYESTEGSFEDTESSGGEVFNLNAFYLADLALIDVASGKSESLVRDERIGWYALSPDGTRVAYATPKRFYKPPLMERVYDLIIVNLATPQRNVVASDVLLDDVFSWSPDGAQLAYGTYGRDESDYRYYVAGSAGDPPREILALPHRAYQYHWQMPLWDPHGGAIYVLRDGALSRVEVSSGKSTNWPLIQGHKIVYRLSSVDGVLWTTNGGKSTIVLARDEEQKQEAFYKIDLATGRSDVLLERHESYSGKWITLDTRPYLAATSPDGQQLAYIAEDAGHSEDLWITDPEFRNPRQLTHLNPQLSRYQMGGSRIVTWLGDDGEVLHGALLLPSTYESGRRYPLIVWVYPGASLSDRVDRFGLTSQAGAFNLQLFATRGYAVLMPDAASHVGDRVQSLAKSVLSGVSKIVEMGIGDPERIGVIGDSQGGYAVLALITQTNRFKAAVSIAGWGDFFEYYGLMDRGGSGYQYAQAERQLGGTPWQFPERYIQNSPFYSFDRVETPLLLVHGSEDTSHPAFLADEVFVGLRRLGKRVEYARYQGETHVPGDWSFANQMDLASRMIQWFDRFLKPAMH